MIQPHAEKIACFNGHHGQAPTTNAILSTAESPVTSFSDQSSQFLQVLLVDFVEAIGSSAIYVDDGDDLLCFPIGPCDDGHDDLALAVPVAGNMTWEVLDIIH